MRSRMIIIDIDSIVALLKDYCGQVGFPTDAVPVKFMLNPQEQKLGLVVESEEFRGPQAAEEVKFDLRRVFGVGPIANYVEPAN